MSKLKIGIIGIGHLGRLHLKLLSEITEKNKNISISGIYDADNEKMKASAGEFNIKAFSNDTELIQNSDAVIIVTPTSTHFEIAERVLTAGKHLFIEKPVTENTDETKKLLKLTKKTNLKVQVGHIERFNPAILAIDKYRLTPLFIESHRLGTYNPRGTDVSVIQDLMIHDIDIILNLVKSPVEKIDANGVAIISDKIDIANARIQFANGCVANVTASRISINKMRKMRIFQKSAYISIDFQSNTSEVFRLMNDEELKNEGLKEGEFAEFPLGEKKIIYEQAGMEDINPLKYELEKFIECINENKEPVVTLEDGRQALEVASQIIEEAENSLKKIKG